MLAMGARLMRSHTLARVDPVGRARWHKVKVAQNCAVRISLSCESGDQVNALSDFPYCTGNVSSFRIGRNL